MSDDFSNIHTSALGDPCQGKAAYLERLPRFLARFEGLEYAPEEILVVGDRAAVAYVMRASYDDHPIEIHGMFRLVIHDGLIVRRVDYFDSLTFLHQTGQG